MTAKELRNKFNDQFGIMKIWPKTYLVDYETYCNVLQEIIIYNAKKDEFYKLGNEQDGQYYIQKIKLGMTYGGILFKGVELYTAIHLNYMKELIELNQKD